MFNSIKPMKIKDYIIDEIEKLILEEKIVEGQKLPSENEIATEFGVSRASVREALTILESRGIIERVKNGGTILSSFCLSKILNSIDYPSKCDYELLEDVYDVREILEVKSARLAAEKCDENDILRIKKTLDLLKESIANKTNYIHADLLFHQCIGIATKNQVLAGMIKSLGDMVKEKRIETLNYPNRIEECFNEHFQIYESIKHHDEDKSSMYMKEHFDKVREIIKKVNSHS